nr:YcxB family protein [uncultured Flavobacterium sp.]
MKLKYSLNQDDFLIHQLYISSKSETVRKARRKSLIWVIIMFIIIGLMFYDRNELMTTYVFGGMAIITLFLYPFYLASHYKKHYKKFILDTYKNRFNKESEVTFEPEFFKSSSEGNETKMSLSEVEEINEIQNHIFLRLKSGGGLIIKKSKIENITAFKDYLKKLSIELDIKYIEDLNWKWK